MALRAQLTYAAMAFDLPATRFTHDERVLPDRVLRAAPTREMTTTGYPKFLLLRDDMSVSIWPYDAKDAWGSWTRLKDIVPAGRPDLPRPHEHAVVRLHDFSSLICADGDLLAVLIVVYLLELRSSAGLMSLAFRSDGSIRYCRVLTGPALCYAEPGGVVAALHQDLASLEPQYMNRVRYTLMHRPHEGRYWIVGARYSNSRPHLKVYQLDWPDCATTTSYQVSQPAGVTVSPRYTVAVGGKKHAVLGVCSGFPDRIIVVSAIADLADGDEYAIVADVLDMNTSDMSVASRYLLDVVAHA